MNPYAPPSEDTTPSIAKPNELWMIRTRVKLFVSFAFASLLLTFGFLYVCLALFLGDIGPLKSAIAHRNIIAFVGIGLLAQCLLSTIAFNRKLAGGIVVGNCVVLGIQLFLVYALICRLLL